METNFCREIPKLVTNIEEMVATQLTCYAQSDNQLTSEEWNEAAKKIMEHWFSGGRLGLNRFLKTAAELTTSWTIEPKLLTFLLATAREVNSGVETSQINEESLKKIGLKEATAGEVPLVPLVTLSKKSDASPSKNLPPVLPPRFDYLNRQLSNFAQFLQQGIQAEEKGELSHAVYNYHRAMQPLEQYLSLAERFEAEQETGTNLLAYVYFRLAQTYLNEKYSGYDVDLAISFFRSSFRAKADAATQFHLADAQERKARKDVLLKIWQEYDDAISSYLYYISMAQASPEWKKIAEERLQKLQKIKRASQRF